MNNLPSFENIEVKLAKGFLFVTLNRPECRNAMNLKMVNELVGIIDQARDDVSVRAVILRGAGGNFCSGGDVKDMAGASGQMGDPYYNLNRRFGTLITRVNELPKPVIVVLEGAVLGGGFGLACVSDVALAHESASFGMPETGLGLPPAQIAPFVVNRIGLTQARRLGVLGARFDGNEALRLGLVHTVFDSPETRDIELETVLAQVRRCAPGAIEVTKRLMLSHGSMPLGTLLDQAARDFSQCIRSKEGREGIAAFKEKRLPYWAEDN